METARSVGHLGNEANETLIGGETAVKDTAERGCVDVAPTERDYDTPSLDNIMILATGQYGREARGAAAFDNDFLVLEQTQDAERNLALLDNDDVISVHLSDLKGVGADSRNRQAVGQRRCRQRLDRPAFGESRGERGAGCWLDPDYLGLRPQCLNSERDACKQSGTTARHHHEIELVKLVHELQAESAGAGDNGHVVVSIDVCQPSELRRRLGECLCFADIRPVDHDVRIKGPTLLTFRQRSHRRHEHRHWYPQLLAMPRQRQGMVAG